MEERINQDFRQYYDIIELIGKGTFGYVIKGKLKNNNELRAIKIIDLDRTRENLIYIKQLIQEFENMKICSINNKNSVKCYEYFNNEREFVIIMELCDKNLSQLLYERMKNENKGFNKDEILKIMKELNNTFKIMKENKIIHRDLKL